MLKILRKFLKRDNRQTKTNFLTDSEKQPSPTIANQGTSQAHVVQAVIITAIESEFKAVVAHISDRHEEEYNGTLYEVGLFKHWRIAVAQIGMGDYRAALETERAIQHFKPSHIFFVGIAGGIKEVKLGDVVTASKVYSYEFGKVDDDGFKIRHEIGQSTYAMVQRGQSMAREDNWHQWIENQEDYTPKAIVKPIVAGEKVLASVRSKIYQGIRANYNDAVAVEMEGIGFLTAIHANSGLQGVEALIIRGISDLLAGKSPEEDAQWQPRAARHAAGFTFALLNKLSQLPLSSQPNTTNPATQQNDFLTRYLDYLKNDHAYLKFKGLSTSSNMPAISLDSIYIALKAVAGEGEREEQRIELSEIDKEREKIYTIQNAVKAEFLESHFYHANDAIQNTTAIDDLIVEHPRLVIVGEPGSGKSTVLDYILLQLIQKPQAFAQRFGFQKAPIPIFLSLRFINPQTLPSLNNLSQICLPILHEQCPERFFEKYVMAGHCVFLFDGLDEITDPTERRQVRDWIEQVCASYPNNRYVVTSRIVGYREAPLHSNFQKYRLCDFDWQDIRIFSDHWQNAVHRKRPGESDADHTLRIQQRVDRLLEILNEKPGIRRLAANPLLLTILMLVYNNRTRLPEERSRLYEECINVLLEHLQKARMEEIQTSAFKPSQALKLEQQRDLLKAMAYWLHRHGQREVDEQKICAEVLANLFPTFGLDPNESAPAFLHDVEELSGLVIRRGGGIGFTHLTFQEYLTAQECADQDSNEAIAFLVDKRFSSWWREVIQLYAGIIPDASALIQQLLSEPDTPLHHVLLLTGQCLADARRVKNLALRQQVIDKLVNLYQSTPFHYIRFQARQVLVRIGTPEVAQVFTQILQTQIDDILRIRDAVEVLSRLHTGIAIKKPLVDLLTKSEMPVEVIEIALRGLRNLDKLDDEVQALLFSYMQPEQLRALRQEAVTTLGVLSSDPKVIQHIRTEILENEADANQLDAVYVAAAKGFIRYLPGEQALELLLTKMALPTATEFKVELCRAMQWINIPKTVLREKLLILLQEGVDWGARGGAALTLGNLKIERELIAQALACRLPEEDSIGVRLRLAEALAHLGWLDDVVKQALKQSLQTKNHLQIQTRWKLVETYARLTHDESFIQTELVEPILALSQNPASEHKNIEPVFVILEQLAYYTDELTSMIINHLNDLAEPIAKDALLYISSASFIPQDDRKVLLAYLKNKKDDETTDLVLRNCAFETLYSLWDIL